jgi:lipopolysaccharide transport system ATP-binding protein
MGTISVTNLGKAYKQYPNRFGRLLEWVTPGNAKRHQLKWVLQGINFTVNSGEAVGIIGMNGAGKSTLLKLITGTTQPTTGSVQMTGRVAAMLELGMGFHPDFTGRQNAFMAAQLLGITSEDIAHLMPEIEAFAEIGDYIDQPVRVYSSGMQMRLAFSVATAIRPDILIVDEALSVGDAYFVHKSFARIKTFREQGTTLLIVSHDKHAIQSICDRAILIKTGALVMEGLPEDVFNYYNAILSDGSDEVNIKIGMAGDVESSGTRLATIDAVRIIKLNGQEVYVASTGDTVEVHVVVKVHQPLDSLVLGCGFKDKYGQMVFGTNSYHVGGELKDLQAGSVYKYVIRFEINLGPGSYSLNLAIHSGVNHLQGNYEWIDRAAIIQIVNSTKYEFAGLVWNPMYFSINKFSRNELFENVFCMPEVNISVANAKYGPMLVYKDDEVIGKSLIESGSFQENKISDVILFLKVNYDFEPKVFVDIGANIGTHSIYSLKNSIFENAICFEPNEDNFKLLQSNFILNNVEKFGKLEKIALSNFSGEIEMELSKSNRGDHRIKAKSTRLSFGEEMDRIYDKVNVVTIDEYTRQNESDWSKSLVWMDTQGHEGFIFSGGSEFFKSIKSSPFIVAEFWPYGIERSSGYKMYFDFLDGCKKIYNLNSVEGEDFKEVSVFELSEIYKTMLYETRKEFHPHTDLLLVL